MNLEEEPPKTPAEGDRRRQLYILLGAAILGAVIAGLLLASSIWSWKKEVKPPETNQTAAQPVDPEKACALQSTYDGIKRELFRRAARTRGSQQDALMRIADFSLLRVQGPYLKGVDDQIHRVTCSGIAVLQLPPQITTAEGTGTLSASIDYAVQPSADGNGSVVNLGDANAITVPLATIRGTAPSGPPPQFNAPSDAFPDELPQPQQPEQSGPQPPQPQPQSDNSDASDIQAGFDCNKARTSSERAVCSNAGLASLDRQMNAQFSSAMRNADGEQRSLLESTRSRFLAYRNRCGSDRCIADAYRGRMQEIRDIMSGQWQPQ